MFLLAGLSIHPLSIFYLSSSLSTNSGKSIQTNRKTILLVALNSESADILVCFSVFLFPQLLTFQRREWGRKELTFFEFLSCATKFISFASHQPTEVKFFPLCLEDKETKALSLCNFYRSNILHMDDAIQCVTIYQKYVSDQCNTMFFQQPHLKNR